MTPEQKAKRNAAAREYYRKNKERLYAKERERLATPEGRAKRLATMKTWKARNPEKVKATDARYYRNHTREILDRRRPYQAAWFRRLKDDPERYAAYLARQNERKRKKQKAEKAHRYYLQRKKNDPVAYALQLWRLKQANGKRKAKKINEVVSKVGADLLDEATQHKRTS